jgi:hypothetical protein
MARVPHAEIQVLKRQMPRPMNRATRVVLWQSMGWEMK